MRRWADLITRGPQSLVCTAPRGRSVRRNGCGDTLIASMCVLHLPLMPRRQVASGATCVHDTTTRILHGSLSDGSARKRFGLPDDVAPGSDGSSPRRDTHAHVALNSDPVRKAQPFSTRALRGHDRFRTNPYRSDDRARIPWTQRLRGYQPIPVEVNTHVAFPCGRDHNPHQMGQLM